jgi:hypothetical protein
LESSLRSSGFTGIIQIVFKMAILEAETPAVVGKPSSMNELFDGNHRFPCQLPSFKDAAILGNRRCAVPR